MCIPIQSLLPTLLFPGKVLSSFLTSSLQRLTHGLDIELAKKLSSSFLTDGGNDGLLGLAWPEACLYKRARLSLTKNLDQHGQTQTRPHACGEYDHKESNQPGELIHDNVCMLLIPSAARFHGQT
jgi:hypothetical protein